VRRMSSDVPAGAVVLYPLPPGKARIPEGWRLHHYSNLRFGCANVLRTVGLEDEEGLNPYQPDQVMYVMVEKL